MGILGGHFGGFLRFWRFLPIFVIFEILEVPDGERFQILVSNRSKSVKKSKNLTGVSGPKKGGF